MTYKTIILSLQEITQKLLEDLHVYHEHYVSVLRCLHVFTSSLPKHPLGKQVTYCYSFLVKHGSFLFQGMISEEVFILSLCLLLCCFAPCVLKWRQMLSCYGQRTTACGFFSGVDDTLSVNRNEFPGGGRCTDQQNNPHIDFPTSGVICMHCRQCILFYHRLAC